MGWHAQHHLRYADDVDEAFFAQQQITAAVKNRTTLSEFQRVQAGAAGPGAHTSSKKTRNVKKQKQRNLTPSY